MEATNRSQPNVVTISTQGEQQPGARQAMTYPVVRRQVAPGRVLDWHGCQYTAGAIVRLRSDLAFPFEQDGVLLKPPGETL